MGEKLQDISKEELEKMDIEEFKEELKKSNLPVQEKARLLSSKVSKRTTTSIQITKELHLTLQLLKRPGESYDSLIYRLLENKKTLEYLYKLINSKEFGKVIAELQKYENKEDE